MRHFAKSSHKAGKIVTKLAGLAQQHIDALQARHCRIFKIAIVPIGKSVFHVRRARSQCGCVDSGFLPFLQLLYRRVTRSIPFSKTFSPEEYFEPFLGSEFVFVTQQTSFDL
jgi:hypothetical protein